MNRRRVVACYCATFLKPEMLHVYRQISAVNRFQVKAFTQKRENADTMPYEDVVVVPKGPWRWLRRIVDRQILRKPLLLSGNEVNRLQVELRAQRCHLLHIVFGNTAVQLLPLLRHKSRRYPAIASFHGADVLVDTENPAYKKALQDVLDRVDLVLARSQSLIAELIKLGCPPEKIRLNRTGIPIGKFGHQPRQWPTDGAWKILQACRLIEKKGVATSLRAFAVFAKSHPLATFTIAGEGSERLSLEKLAGELGVSDKVQFTGFLNQEDLKHLFYASHLFLHPSQLGVDGNQEGIPNSLLEAMATGLPVFATRHGGIAEAITNGVNGYLVAEKDDQALAAKLIEVTNNFVQLDTISSAAFRTIADEFSTNVQARKLEDYYQEAIEEAWIGAENKA